MVSGSEPATAEAATELMKAMTRLRARLRAESAPTEMSSTWSQLTTLARIVKEGSTTISALAHAEHVRRQSMAETVARLREDGLIRTDQDATDGRKTLISATREGQTLITTIPVAREAWLDLAIRTLLRQHEQKTLLRAAEIMNRIADSDVRLAR
jgi:DNA-binding MarR family transcriptional regulator